MFWESVFFPRDNSLVSAGQSHSSGVRGLVVRFLLFNPEVSCSNRCVSAILLQAFRSRRVPFPLFWHYDASPFQLCETFFENFLMSSKSPTSIFLIFCIMDGKKLQRVPSRRFFGIIQNSHFFWFFAKIFKRF